jgi:6,7-dimethyl-8-ribityllumazine synthase
VSIHEGGFDGKGLRFAVLVSRFNSYITEELLKGAEDALKRHGVAAADIEIYRVPGTFELPALLRRVVQRGKVDGVVVLGCLIRGGTPHFEHLSSAVTKGVAEVALDAPCAVAFGVLTCDTVEQAVERAGTKMGNKGFDAAVACLETANLYRHLDKG